MRRVAYSPPIMTDTVEAHDIHRELYELPAATLQALAHPPGRRVPPLSARTR